MTNADRIRLHELVYARASILEAEAIAEELSKQSYGRRVTSALIIAMAVAYFRPFMGAMRPDGTKRAPLNEDIAIGIDRDTHLNVKKFRHEVCAHKDLSVLTTNIPIVAVANNGSINIHSLLAMGIELNECARIRSLCLKLVEVLEKETGGLLGGVAPPAAGQYTLNHGAGSWLVPLNEQSLGRANLVREPPNK